MSYEIALQKRFIKAVKKLKLSGKKHLVVAAEEAVQLLEQSDNDSRAKWVLHHQWHDHALGGHHKSKRELHLGKDVLLIYQRHEQENLIELHDITSHEELRKKN